MRTRSFRSPRLLPAAALVTAGALVLAACGTDDTDTEPPAGNELSTNAGETPRGGTTGEDPPIEAPDLSEEESGADDPEGQDAPDTEPVSAGLLEPTDASLTVSDIRIGVREDADRVVFELDGTGTPGYEVSYVAEPSQQGSGMAVEVPGDAFLQVQINGQTLPIDADLTETPVGTVSSGQATVVGGVAFSGQFEGLAQSFIGVNGRERPFTAFLLDSPTRLVVDIER